MEKKEALIPVKGLDIITLESHDVVKWLATDNENIVIYVQRKNKHDLPLLVKKSYFVAPALNTILLKCSLYRNQLDVEETYKSKKYYRNIGFFLGNKAVVSNTELVKMLNDKKARIFKLEYTKDIMSVISLEYLQMSKIGLVKLKGATAEEKKAAQKNLPYKKEVYFEDVLAKALTDYSYRWDQPINQYLRYGLAYFDTFAFLRYYDRYGDTEQLAAKAIIDKIALIDKCFLEYAPRTSGTKQHFYWRGMKDPYEFVDASGKRKAIKEVGDTFVTPNYMSVSKSKEIAFRFSGFPSGTPCCLYKIVPDKGIPYIDMVTTTKFKNEREILLPRRLVSRVTKFEYSTAGYPIYTLQIMSKTLDQFKTYTGCDKYLLATISKFTPSGLYPAKTKQVTKKARAKVPVLDADVRKSSRCPNGTRRNKKTGLCEPAHTRKTTTKKPRCPNGTRRNKRSGECVSG